MQAPGGLRPFKIAYSASHKRHVLLAHVSFSHSPLDQFLKKHPNILIPRDPAAAEHDDNASNIVQAGKFFSLDRTQIQADVIPDFFEAILGEYAVTRSELHCEALIDLGVAVLKQSHNGMTAPPQFADRHYDKMLDLLLYHSQSSGEHLALSQLATELLRQDGQPLTRAIFNQRLCVLQAVIPDSEGKLIEDKHISVYNDLILQTYEDVYKNDQFITPRYIHFLSNLMLFSPPTMPNEVIDRIASNDTSDCNANDMRMYSMYRQLSLETEDICAHATDEIVRITNLIRDDAFDFPIKNILSPQTKDNLALAARRHDSFAAENRAIDANDFLATVDNYLRSASVVGNDLTTNLAKYAPTRYDAAIDGVPKRPFWSHYLSMQPMSWMTRKPQGPSEAA